MSKFWESEEFTKEQKQWYDKIASTPDSNGEVFVDAENTTRKDKPLKAWHNYRFKDIPIDTRVGTQTYYERAEELLHTYEFENDTHRTIWELHCKGLSERAIAGLISHLTPTYKHSIIGKITSQIAKSIRRTN